MTAYVDAALHTDDRGTIAEAAQTLIDVGRQLMETAADDIADFDWYRSQGRIYAASGTCSLATILTRTADQPSLERALTLAEEASHLLASAADGWFDKVNIAHVEVLAALQLGDLGRVRRAISRGAAAAARLQDERQKKFFERARRIAEAIRPGPTSVRSIPELEYSRAATEEGSDAALTALCAALERELVTDVTGPTTIERLVLAAQLQDWVNALIAALGGRALTRQELTATVREHGQPVLLLHLTDNRVAAVPHHSRKSRPSRLVHCKVPPCFSEESKQLTCNQQVTGSIPVASRAGPRYLNPQPVSFLAALALPGLLPRVALLALRFRLEKYAQRDSCRLHPTY